MIRIWVPRSGKSFVEGGPGGCKSKMHDSALLAYVGLWTQDFFNELDVRSSGFLGPRA